MSDQVEEQVRLAVDAIRGARKNAGRFDHRALTSLTERIKASAEGPSDKDRRSFLEAVGSRLKEEAGSSKEVKLQGIAGKQRLFDDPDGDTIHTFGELLIRIAKKR